MGIFLRSTITVAHIYVGAAEAAGGRPRRHKEEEEESHRGHPVGAKSSQLQDKLLTPNIVGSNLNWSGCQIYKW